MVVAIIALLAALLLPALRNARDKGKAATCVNNLRQSYLAFALYATDSQGRVPPYMMYGSSNWAPYWVLLGDGYLGGRASIIRRAIPIQLHNRVCATGFLNVPRNEARHSSAVRIPGRHECMSLPGCRRVSR